MTPDPHNPDSGLSYHDAIQRAATIKEIVAFGNKQQLAAMMDHLMHRRLGNAIAIAVVAMGESGRSQCIPLLVDAYGSASDNEKRLIIEALLKLGAFQACFPAANDSSNIKAQLWSLLFGCSSNQLRSHLGLAPAAFQAKLDLAWKATKHWRK